MNTYLQHRGYVAPAMRISVCYSGLLAATLIVLTSFPLPSAQAQAPETRGANLSTNALVSEGDVRVSRRRVRPGEIIKVTLTLRNQGSGSAVSQGTPPSKVLTQGQTTASTANQGGYGIALALSGPRGNEWPYRWGLGKNIGVGQARTISVPLRMTKPGLYTLYVGIAAGSAVRELSLGQIGIEVAPRGQKFTTGTSGPIGTPAPTHLTVNGKTVTTDQRPVYYKNNRVVVPEEPEIMVPIRFVTEELGAQVEWLPASRTVQVERGKNSLMVRVGSTRHSVNGETGSSQVPPRIVNGRTMVPLHFIVQKLGGSVNWNLRTQTLAITMPNLSASQAGG